VVHHPERIEPRPFGGDRDLGDPLEQSVVRDVGEREARQLQSEMRHVHGSFRSSESLDVPTGCHSRAKDGTVRQPGND